jgi:hypothetical protein
MITLKIYFYHFLKNITLKMITLKIYFDHFLKNITLKMITLKIYCDHFIFFKTFYLNFIIKIQKKIILKSKINF